jgi:hypothetical protein
MGFPIETILENEIIPVNLILPLLAEKGFPIETILENEIIPVNRILPLLANDIIDKLKSAGFKSKGFESIMDSGNQIPKDWMDEIEDHRKLTGKPSIKDCSELLERIKQYNRIIKKLKTPTSIEPKITKTISK